MTAHALATVGETVHVTSEDGGHLQFSAGEARRVAARLLCAAETIEQMQRPLSDQELREFDAWGWPEDDEGIGG
jgi:hypothetical protein